MVSSRTRKKKKIIKKIIKTLWYIWNTVRGNFSERIYFRNILNSRLLFKILMLESSKNLDISYSI